MQRIALFLFTVAACLAQQLQPPAATPLQMAVVQYRQGNLNAALDILDAAVADQPAIIEHYLLRGDIYSMQGQGSRAIENYSEAIKHKDDSISAFYRRAMEYFRSGKMKEAIADYNKMAELEPARASQLWQRGICYYYLGEFDKGRKQFESHQSVNQQDVENAVWHFLCVAKLEGFEKARAQLIPISGDPRVPMAQVFGVFAGTGTEEDVMKAAEAGSPKPEQLRQRMFFAHFYLGLFQEAKGNSEASLEHLRKAAGEFGQKNFMGDVARVHLALRDKK